MVTDGGTVEDGIEQIADRIRRFAETVDQPDDWMIIVPVDDYNAVKETLDTKKDVSTFYQGIVLCYGDGCDETQVKLKRSLADHLRSPDAGGESGQ